MNLLVALPDFIKNTPILLGVTAVQIIGLIALLVIIDRLMRQLRK